MFEEARKYYTTSSSLGRTSSIVTFITPIYIRDYRTSFVQRPKLSFFSRVCEFNSDFKGSANEGSPTEDDKNKKLEMRKVQNDNVGE